MDSQNIQPGAATQQAVTPPDDGGWAFPVNTANIGMSGALYPEGGMTLRDYFAAAALPAMISADLCSKEYAVRDAYEYADTMIAFRKQAF